MQEHLPIPPVSSKQAKAEATLARLVAVAWAEFAEIGYAETATNDIVAKAQVTRGALYYHFKDKQDLFRRVVEVVAEEVLAKILHRAEAEPTVWQGLVEGCHAFIDACAEPDIRQILLIDAPAVLGWQAWREIDAKYAMGSLADVLALCIESGDIAPRPLPALTHLISGALNEAALLVAESVDPDATRAAVKAETEHLLAGLRLYGRDTVAP